MLESMSATAPGKLILTGEYAVLDGAPALVVAMDRRVTARYAPGVATTSSAFLLALANELARRYGDDAAARALSIVVDSSSFYDGDHKLGLGSSAAVTVAATALALAGVSPVSTGSSDASASSGGPRANASLEGGPRVVDKNLILEIACAAHAHAQGAMGARGSGADIASAVHGGAIVFSRRTGGSSDTSSTSSTNPAASTSHASPASQASTFERTAGGPAPPRPHDAYSITKRTWPRTVRIVPFFTGTSASTAELVARVAAARVANPVAVEAALVAITEASNAACKALAAPADLAQTALIAALSLAGSAIDRLAIATGVDLVPSCVSAARAAMGAFGGTAKTTGAGGGDIGIAVIPATADVTDVCRALIQARCQVLQLSVDETGVDLRTNAL